MRTSGRWAIAALLLTAGTAMAQLPPGFTRTMIMRDFGGISSIVPLPGGRVLASTLFGFVNLLQEGQEPLLILQIPDVVTTDEHGVLGLCVDPDFADNGYFYVLYTGPGPYNEVARYTLVGTAVDPASKVVIWQNPDLCPGSTHQGGGIQFGPDENLYIATGDQFDDPTNAQTLANQHGKILRLAADGSIPPDNPFLNTPGAQAAIWAYGFRNPFRMTIDQPTGTVWISDVGQVTWEEIDKGQAGANYGWPMMEGPLCSVPSCSAFTPPVWSYLHGDPVYTPNYDACAIVGPIYRGTAFPAEYRGNLFYADYANGWIKRLVFDASGAVAADLLFDAGPTSRFITDLKQGPDGALYYAVVQDNPDALAGVYRISATTPGNQPPVVVADATPRQGNPTLNVQFSSAGTDDPDHGPQPLTYLWNFGDGQTSTLASPAHAYAVRGQYAVTLTVSDGADPVTSPQMLITVGQAPTAVITSPGPEFYYAAGDTISFSGIASDAEDGVLPASAFTWAVVLEHLTHEHPFIPSIPGVRSGSFVIPTTGHDPENTHFRIRLTVHDSDGIPTVVTHDIYPYVSPLTLDTAPSGIPILLDGRALETPRLYGSVEGFHHTISAQPSFVLGETAYVFRRWSNNQPRVFSFDSPEGGLILTAEYGPACYANCDGSTVVPILTANDFQCFLNRFASADALANCDGSTTIPVLTANDFQCFLNSFAAGCS